MKPLDQLPICRKCKGQRNILNCPIKVAVLRMWELYRSKGLKSSTDNYSKRLKRHTNLKKMGKMHLGDNTVKKLAKVII